MDTVKLDADLFQGILRKYEKNDSIIVERVDIKPAVEKGNNFASIVSRVSIKGIKVEDNNERSDYEISLIIKQLVRNKILLETYHFDMLFTNESESYNIIIPTLAKYTPTGMLKTPSCLLANKDIVVLKDLSQEGYKHIDKKKDFQIDEVKLTLTELAKLHAASFVLRQENPEQLDYLGTLSQEVFFKDNESLFKLQKTNFELAIHVFKELDPTSSNLNAIKVLEDLRQSSTDIQIKLFTENRKYKVINHGDTWGNNILFKEDSVILIDFQKTAWEAEKMQYCDGKSGVCRKIQKESYSSVRNNVNRYYKKIMRYASVAADLSYFLYINMHPVTRRQNFNILLQHYLDVLHEQTNACGVDMSAKLTIEWLRGEMNDFTVFGLTTALWLMPIFHYEMSDLDLDDFKEDDWNQLDWHISRITDSYRHRVVELVLDFVQNLVE